MAALAAAGYALYLAAVFVPGYGVGELLGLWRAESHVAGRLGFAFGMGLALDTVVYAFRTLGPNIGPVSFKGFDASVAYVMILIGVAALGASYYRKRALSRLGVTSMDLGVLALCGLLGVLALAYFQKYPLFPEYYSPDFARHVQDATGLVSGTLVTLPREILYGAGNYQLASAIVLVGGEPLVTVQRSMALVLACSPLLVYAAAQRVLSTERGALLAAALYTLTGTVWFSALFVSGLYANFVGVLLSFFLVFAFLEVSARPGSRGVWVGYGVAVAAAYFSHFSTLSVFPGFLAPLVYYAVRRRQEFRRFVRPLAVLAAPAVVGAVMFPRVVSRVLGEASQGGGTVLLSTPLSSLLSPVPVLSYLAVETQSDVGLLVTVALAVFAVYWGYRGRHLPLSILVVWLVGLLVFAPFGVSAWRFSLEAAVPLVLLSGYGLHALLLRVSATRGVTRMAAGRRRAMVLGVTGLLIFAAGATSWGTAMALDSGTGTRQIAAYQGHVLTAIEWLGHNTPSGSGYLSLTDPQFLYVGTLFARPAVFITIQDEASAVSYAKQYHLEYVVVTNVPTSAGASPAGYDPWDTFKAVQGVSLVYGTADVRVFHVS